VEPKPKKNKFVKGPRGLRYKDLVEGNGKVLWLLLCL